MSQTNWEADKMLDVYIYDYLVKRNLRETAKAFQAEAKVSPDPVAIDAPGGFLFEWWSVFWDIFIARTNEKHSDTAASYIETQQIKAREQQQQQQPQQPQQQQQQMQMQQIFLQRQAQQLQQQQQLREGAHILNGTANRLAASDPLMRQNPGTANAMATKMYEDQLKLPLQRDSSEEASVKQRIGENGGQLLDPNHASLLKSAATSGQASGQILHGSAGGLPGTLQHVQARNQQLAGSAQDIKADMNSALNSRGTDASFIGMPGSNQVGNSLTLKGWPLTGLDQLRSGLLQQQKPFTQSSQPFNQLQFLSPQQQQQLVIQAQQNLTSSPGDIDSIKLRTLLNNRNLGLGKDGHSSSTGEAISNAGSPMQSGGGPVVPRPETDILNKKMAQFQQQQQLQSSNQQQQHHAIIGQQSQSSNQYVHQQEKSVDNVTAFKNQSGNKRKQPVSSSGPANSSGTANTAGPSPNSAPSTPSTHTPGDVISVSSLQHNCSSSKPLSVFGSDGAGPISSAQLAGIDRFVDDGSLEENVESFFSPDDTDLRDTAGRCGDGNKGFTFSEAGSTRASTNKVVCCHFSSDGKLLATGAHDKKAVLWYADTLKPQSTLQEHSLLITDVRFSPSMPRLATSSFDKTVRVWDADNPGYSLRTFTGHSTSVMSLDFHPSKEDLICSCDVDGEMRYWSIINGSCARVFKGGSAQMRFQPRLGRYLAAAAQNGISIIDTDTQACRYSLQGHMKHVISVCWDPSGELVASVSEDSVRVWSVGSGGEGECVHELNCNGSKFQSCVFHPTYPTLLVIGCYQSIELWDMAQDKTMTLPAHEGLVASLAASSVTGMVASVSHDTFVKLWK